MPTLKFEKSALLAYIKGMPDDEVLQETISMIGTDLESFGEEITVEVFPNRPDLLSVPGLARALNHYLGNVTQLDTYTVVEGKREVKVLKGVEKVRPHTRCCIVRDVVYTDEKIKEVIDVQEKLHVTFGRNRKKVAIGIYPMEQIAFPITFGAEKPENIVFRALEWEKEADARKIVKEHPAGIAYGKLLEGATVYPVFKDADGAVLSVPPIINSHETGRIDENTKDVFIECSGHDERVLEEAITMIACAFSDMGGTIESVNVVYEDKTVCAPDLRPKTMNVDRAYMAQRAGIPQAALEGSLKKMGLHLEGDVVTIPAYRVDFQHQVDVVEDAAIGFGYMNIVPTIPKSYTAGKLDETYALLTKIRDVLAGAGLQEVMTYFLTEQGVKLSNPVTEQYSCLRKNITGQLLGVLEKNTSNLYPQHIFEVGPVFREDRKAETHVGEQERVAVLLCGDEADYTKVRQLLDYMAAQLSWKLKYEEHDDPRFIPGRCAKVTGDLNGLIGEVHPEQLASRGVLFPAAAFEVSIPHRK